MAFSIKKAEDLRRARASRGPSLATSTGPSTPKPVSTTAPRKTDLRCGSSPD